MGSELYFHIDSVRIELNYRASLVAQLVKNLPAMQETWVQSLGQKDPLEKGMATHSSVLAWRITWTEESVRLQSMGSQIVGNDLTTNASLFNLISSTLSYSENRMS